MIDEAQPSAVIKRQLDDWQVTEIADHAFTESGEHAWFYVEKKNRNTVDVARDLSRALALPSVAIGYAGRKDKHGVTRQWFSAQTPTDEWPGIEGTQCLAVHRHQRKLRIGQLEGNSFRLTLRDLQPRALECFNKLAEGFPNRFGRQRFSGENLPRAQHWLKHRRRRRIPQDQQSWHLSVLRSHLFNVVLEARLASGTLPAAMDGDLLIGGFPSAPLWGRGRSATKGEAALLEQRVLEPFAEQCEGLEHAGVNQGRRSLFVRPCRFTVQSAEEDNSVLFEFQLPPGAYATTLLAEQFQLVDEGGR